MTKKDDKKQWYEVINLGRGQYRIVMTFAEFCDLYGEPFFDDYQKAVQHVKAQGGELVE